MGMHDANFLAIYMYVISVYSEMCDGKCIKSRKS